MNHKTIMYALITVSLLIATIGYTQTYTMPKLSSYDIANWANQGGFIASGSATPITAPPKGSLYVDESIPNLPVLWRFNGSVWYKISGGASKHFELLNLDYATAGHTGFAPITAIPNNASFTLALLGNKDFANLTGKPTNASYTLTGLSEKDFASLTGKPTNASYTLTGLGEKNFASLAAKPTTLLGYGITDGALNASLTVHIADNIDPHGATMTVTQEMIVGVGSMTAYIDSPAERILRAVASETIITEKLTVGATVTLNNMPVYADNATAIANGAAVGSLFRTPDGTVMLAH